MQINKSGNVWIPIDSRYLIGREVILKMCRLALKMPSLISSNKVFPAWDFQRNENRFILNQIVWVKRKKRLNKKYICSVNLAWIECNDAMKRVQLSKKDKWSLFSKDTRSHIHSELSKESLSKNGMWPQLWNYIQQKKWGGKLIIHLWQRERRWKFQKEIERLEI